MRSETPEQQRVRLNKKRLETSDTPLIKCLECPLQFIRVGSHVVQVHGYESAAEYRKAHGLMLRETRVESYANHMSNIARNYENLKKGSIHRFYRGGNHVEVIKDFWKRRKEAKK